MDMHKVTSALPNPALESNSDTKLLDSQVYANKVCRHVLLSTLSNKLFDIYYHYKEAKEIWENMIVKYKDEDASKQKFVIENYHRWTMKNQRSNFMPITKL